LLNHKIIDYLEYSGKIEFFQCEWSFGWCKNNWKYARILCHL